MPPLLREYPNLYADLSARSGLTSISRDREFGRSFHLELQDRLLFGRDHFDTRLMDYLKDSDLPGEAFGKITSGNALRLLDRYLD